MREVSPSVSSLRHTLDEAWVMSDWAVLLLSIERELTNVVDFACVIVEFAALEARKVRLSENLTGFLHSTNESFPVSWAYGCRCGGGTKICCVDSYYV